MSSHTQRLLKHEADLLKSFADAYRGRFEHVIERLNHTPHTPAAPDDTAACIRLCVETLGMLLATQTHLADALRELSKDDPSRQAA